MHIVFFNQKPLLYKFSIVFFFARQDFELTQHTVHTYMIMAFDCALLLHEVMYQLSVPCEILSRQNTSTQQLSSQPDSRCCNIYS